MLKKCGKNRDKRENVIFIYVYMINIIAFEIRKEN
jgi:hypothetical protein